MHILGLFPEEITENIGIPERYRGKQIFQWLSRGTDSFEAMTNLPADLRKRLSEGASIFTACTEDSLIDKDGTGKLRIRLEDRCLIEAVVLKDKENRKTACLSTQAGCAMACAFCKTGTLGLKRNLSAGEIIEEYLLLKKGFGIIDNVVFMGMGEPLHNLGGVRKAVAWLCHPEGNAMSPKRFTISTCGIAKGIRDLADNGPAVFLAVSLITADQRLRDELMPASRGNPLSDLRDALNYFQGKTGDRITLEIVLLEGRNDREEDLDSLKAFVGRLKVIVNLIAWNPVEGLPFREPSQNTMRRFLQGLEARGIPAVQRYKRGRGIQGACGQLGSIG